MQCLAVRHASLTAQHALVCCRDVSGEIKTPVDWMSLPFTFEPGALVWLCWCWVQKQSHFNRRMHSLP